MLETTKITILITEYGDLLVEINVLKHSLVPKHVILSEEEKQKLLEKFNISSEQLPKISTSDPVVNFLGAKAGDILKIERKSPTAGETLYYRLVIKG